MRFIGNYSSGKMGFAIAEELANNGAKVILVAGPVSLQTSNSNIERIDVESAQEMYEACIDNFDACDAAIMSAAVADFTPLNKELEKVKRGKENYSLELTPNKDIAAELGNRKREDQVLIGFALETNNELFNAKKKLEKKNLDFIILNSLNDKGAGFGVDTNKIKIIDRNGDEKDFPLSTKAEVAIDIVKRFEEYL